ncbi:hypothetical protein [Paenibacillus odorifer]|uniref:hypothetical protein n=1 Tax=Paenibacillus odorifer TaxID=189426 RepID=UPI000BA0BCA6|nr:hypothetical protein [Paenibacillus odorifer]OZQ62847.1 hypothetical protein CA596_29720 [Paenibacillus odorifer]
MSAKTAAIIARLKNKEGVNFFPAERKIYPQGFVVTRDGDVCPLDTLRETGPLSPIYIDSDKRLVCDTTVAATNTEFDIHGKQDLKDAVRRYNNVIDEKLLNGETEDDDGSKIIDFHAY